MIASPRFNALSSAEAQRGQEQFEMRPLFPTDLWDVAEFIHRWRQDQPAANGDTTPKPPAAETRGFILRRLEWLLVENPAAREGSPLGYCVHDEWGAIRGINLCFPCPFLAGNERLVALCSGSFFVQPSARSFGFYLFKRYLSSQGYAFYYATTCNGKSEPLWQMLGGRAVPNSEMEYIVPLRLDAVLSAFLSGKSRTSLGARIGRLAGHGANPILELLTRTNSTLDIEPCQDWEKLAALFYRHRLRDRIASDRSGEFLRWRYGPSSPIYPNGGAYVIRDKQGNEGWISLGMLVRGEVRGPILLDAVWPRDKMTARDIFRAFISLGQGSDVLFLRRPPGFDYRDYCRWAIPHRVDARTFVINPRSTPISLDDLDYDDNDYVAWMFRWDRQAVR